MNEFLQGYMEKSALLLGNKIPLASSFLKGQGYDTQILAHGGYMPRDFYDFLKEWEIDPARVGYDPSLGVGDYYLAPDPHWLSTGDDSLFRENLRKTLKDTICLYSNGCVPGPTGPEYFAQFAPKLKKVTMGLPYSQAHPLNTILPNRFLRGEKIQPTRNYILENGKWKDKGEYNNWLKKVLDIPFSKGPLPILAANRRERKQQDSIKKAEVRGEALINAARVAAIAGVNKVNIRQYVDAMLKRKDSSGGPQFSLPPGGVTKIREILAKN
jgi:hypothetical protein